MVGASRRMNCVASNVTTRLKELEEVLGQALFVREKGRLIVTPAGRLFYREALPVIAGMTRLAGLFDQDAPRGMLTVGALDVALRRYLPEHLPGFAAAYPQIELTLLMRPSYTLESMLASGEIDLALTDGPIQHPLLDSRFAFAEPLSLVVPPGITTVEDIDWQTTTVFLFNTDCFYRSRFESWLKGRSVEATSIHTIESYDVMRAYVKAGRGVSCFPESMLTAEPPLRTGEVNVLRPEDLPASEVYFVWRRDALSDPLARFIDFLPAADTH